MSAYLALLALHLIVVVCYQMGLDSDRLPRLYSRFFFDQEANIPTYFSSVILLMAGALLALIASMKKLIGDRWTMHWKILAVGFVLMSVDESAVLHEMFNKPLAKLGSFSGYLAFGWVLMGMAIALLLAVTYSRFLWALPAAVRRGFVMSAVIFLGGALGTEMVGARLAIDPEVGTASLAYMMLVTIEESMEMLGIILFISVLVNYLKSQSTKLALTD
jgi:MFS family permease